MYISQILRSQNVLETLIKFREWEKSKLPSPKSSLCYELFLIITFHSKNNTSITLYQLYLTLGYTQKAIQHQLKILIQDGWCELLKDPQDKRIKRAVASKKMLDLADQYTIFIYEVVIKNIQSELQRLKLNVE